MSEIIATYKYTLTNYKGSYTIKCTNISTCTKAIIPSTYNNLPVIEIEKQSFYGATNLKYVYIPDSIKTIGEYAFYNCSSLIDIKVDSNNKYYKDINGNLYSKDGKELINYTINKPDTSFTVPDSVESISPYGFAKCKNLNTIVIPNNVKTLGHDVLWACTNLENIVIGTGITSLPQNAFEDCTNLKNVWFLSLTPPKLEYANTFSNINSKAKFCCYSKALNNYKTAKYLWYSFADRFVADDFSLYTIANVNAQKSHFISKEEVKNYTCNIESGQGNVSNVTSSGKYIGHPIIYSDGSIGLRTGSTIPGGIATGFGATALGGMRFGYSDFGSTITLADDITYRVEYTPEQYYFYNPSSNGEWESTGAWVMAIEGNSFSLNNFTYTVKNSGDLLTNAEQTFNCPAIDGLPYGPRDDYEGAFVWASDGLVLTTTINGEEKEFVSTFCYGRTPTSAEGNQSFAAGASVHAIGDFSVALGKDTAAYQRAGLAFGGGTQVGRTEDEFNDWFWDATTNTAKNGGKGLNSNGKVTDEHGDTYNNAYSFALAGGGSSKAYARDSVALGSEAHAHAFGSKSLGYVTHTYGQFSVAVGNQTKVYSDHSFVGGTKSEVSSTYSFGFGDTIKINGLGNSNTGFGYRNEIGTATNTCKNNFAVNGDNKIGPSGNVNNAAVFGYQNTITNSGCLVAGHGNKTAQVYQTVIGEYANPTANDAFVIGGGTGTSDSDRKNIFTVGKTGNVDIAGNLTIGGTTLKISQLASKDGSAILINNDLTVGANTVRLNKLMVDLNNTPGNRNWVDVGATIKSLQENSSSSSCGVEQVVFTSDDYNISNKLVCIKPKEESDWGDRTAYNWNNLAPYDAATPWWYAQNILQGEERYGVCTSFSMEGHGYCGRAFDVKFGVNIQGDLYYFTHFIDHRMLSVWGDSYSLQIPFSILLNNNTIVNGVVCLSPDEHNYYIANLTKAAIQINGPTIELTPSTDSEQQNTIWIAHRIAWNEFGV